LDRTAPNNKACLLNGQKACLLKRKWRLKEKWQNPCTRNEDWKRNDKIHAQEWGGLSKCTLI
jgi:hypothetical protein